MSDSSSTVVRMIRDRVLDPELAALLWLLGAAGVPIHVAAPDVAWAGAVAQALAPLARDPALVSAGRGAALEDVLRLPVPLRPATGAVVILDDRRIVAAHFQRPPLRDGAGHIRPQGPAVLVVWDDRAGTWEHFAWGIIPELAAAAGQRAGDFEIEQGSRREYLEALVASGVDDRDRVAAALAAWAVRGPRQ